MSILCFFAFDHHFIVLWMQPLFHSSSGHSLAHQVKGSIMKASPYTACGPIENADQLRGHIALALRGDCMFAGKARRLQEAGATGVIFIGE